MFGNFANRFVFCFLKQRLQEELEELSKAKARDTGSGNWEIHGDGGWAGAFLFLFFYY